MTVEMLLALLAPLVVFGVTELVKILLPKLPGWSIVGVVVPALSALAAIIANLTVGSAFVTQLIIGLLAVFINELIRQLKQIGASKG
jgi:hypothetical protein